MDARDDRASWLAPDRMDELDNFLPEDKAAARDFLLEIKPLFPLIEIPAFWDDDEGIELIKHLSWYISATVVLADWTGSSTRFFPRVAHPMDIKGYWQKTLVQAQNALTVFPLKAKVAPFNGINTLFPFIENPTPLQQKVLDLDISQQGPQLFILEDVTGAGKTEAALILAHRLIAAGKAQGLFLVCQQWQRPMPCTIGWSKPGLLSIRQNPAPAWCWHIVPAH